MRVWKDINFERPPAGVLVLTFSGGERFGQYLLDEMKPRLKGDVPTFDELGHGVVSHWSHLPKAPFLMEKENGTIRLVKIFTTLHRYRGGFTRSVIAEAHIDTVARCN